MLKIYYFGSTVLDFRKLVMPSTLADICVCVTLTNRTNRPISSTVLAPVSTKVLEFINRIILA
jgi:hypothetical protein